MNSEQYSLIPILGSIIGGCIAAGAGMVLAWHKRRRDGRDRFLAAIAEIEADMPQNDGDFKEYHRATHKPLRLAIYSVQPFVSKRQFAAMCKVWNDYRKIDDKQLEEITTAISQIVDGTAPENVKGVDQSLADFYDRFKEAIR